MKKTILQTVSGGFDSTYLLIKNLNEGHEVYPIYIHSPTVNQIKQTIELNSVKQLLERLHSFNNLKGLTETDINLNGIPNLFSSQPIFWLLGLFNEVKNISLYSDYDEVHIGYILGDGAVSYLHEIKKLWKALFSFSLPDYKVPKLVFPLLKYHKETIIKKLDEYNSEIFDNCWFCETPNIINTKRMKNGNIEMYVESCGECSPCIRTRNIISDNFIKLKKYRAIILINDIYNYLNKTKKTVIRDIKSCNIPYKYITVENIDEKTIKKLILTNKDKPSK